jgi:quercetin dioxygenase-like cupin family protein
MLDEVLYRRETIAVRRLRLGLGEATPWHRDPFHRITIVIRGDALSIEQRDAGEQQLLAVVAGQVDWDEPFDRPHRAVNVGTQTYEEVAVFFLDRPDAVPQPTVG